MEQKSLLFRKRVSVKQPVVKEKAPVVPVVKDTIRVADMEYYLLAWETNGLFRGVSATTFKNRKIIVTMLIWWLTNVDKAEQCGRDEIMRWIAYMRIPIGPKDETGRWGREKGFRQNDKELRPSTIATYFDVVRSWCFFLVKEGHLTESPFNNLDRPLVPVDHIQAFKDEHVQALREAARTTDFKVRDVALIDLAMETGLRVSEIADLRRADIDLDLHMITVVSGKGNKSRQVPFGLEVKQSLVALIRAERLEKDDYLFRSIRGRTTNQKLTTAGIEQLFKRLNKKAGIDSVRVSPHTARHYAATSLLANNADQITVMNVLGHTSLRMTSKYISQSPQQLTTKFMAASPLDTLRKKGQGQGRQKK